jgi:ABC-type dipeptide/oligopeptide/nickel transport system permease component
VAAFIIRRLLLSIPTLIGVMIVVFLLLYVAPGDPVQDMVGERADAETIARLWTVLHLDEPVAKRCVLYAGGVLTGDLGNSYITQRPIIRDIRERFPKTLLLAG